VRHLPHQLIEAFRSTLDEVADADLILHVVDGSDPDPGAQLAAVRTVFGEIGALDIPELIVINKADVAEPAMVDAVARAERHRGNRVVVVSARTGAGVDDLVAALDDLVPRPQVLVDVLLPFSEGRLVARVHEHGEVELQEHTADGTRLRARVPERVAAELGRYTIAPSAAH